MSVDKVRTFAEAEDLDICDSRKESLLALIRAALNFLGRDWHGIQGVHVQVLYTERGTNQVNYVSQSCGSALMLADPTHFYALLGNALKSEALKAEANQANLVGFDECQILPQPAKSM